MKNKSNFSRELNIILKKLIHSNEISAQCDSNFSYMAIMKRISV